MEAELDKRRITAARCGFSISTLDRLVARNEFPQPVQLSPGRVAWRRSEVDGWLSKRPRRDLTTKSKPNAETAPSAGPSG